MTAAVAVQAAAPASAKPTQSDMLVILRATSALVPSKDICLAGFRLWAVLQAQHHCWLLLHSDVISLNL